MIHGGWQAPTHLRTILLTLALLGLAYLLIQTRAGPVRISAWNGGQFTNLAADAASSGLFGQAAAQNSGSQIQAAGDPETPNTNPLRTSRVVMTQGYGVGSHAPAAVWGGIDLAVDSDGDGQAEPGATEGAPIYATIRGIVRIVPNSWPAGNYLSITNDRYKVAYAHLKEYAVSNGQMVELGQLIGYVGATGEASGPHLHYEVWQDGQNVNPLDFGVLNR